MLDTIRSLDGTLLLRFQNAFVYEWLTPIIKFITHLGDRGTVWIAITVILLIFKKTRKAGVFAALALLGSLLINNIILKNLIARERPYEVFTGVKRIIEIQRDYSFPSGHSGSSFAAAVAICLGLPEKLRKSLGIAVIILASFISLSRLYVGVHYPIDVFFGVLNGITIAFSINKAFEYRERRKGIGEYHNDKSR